MPVKRGKLPPTPGDTYKRKLDLELSDEWNEPDLDLGSYPIVIYGEKGVGKTTLCRGFDPYFIFIGKGKQTFRYKGVTALNWEELAHFSSEIQKRQRKGDWDYGPIIIDNLDKMGLFTKAFVCNRLNIKSPQDVQYGKAWDLISNELREVFEPLVYSEYGFIGLSHSALRTVQRADGSEYNRIEPTYDSRVDQILSDVALTGYYYHNKGGRYLRIVGTELVTAKCRFHEDGTAFIARNGNPVKIVNMGESSTDAYENLIAAFNGEQSTSGETKSDKNQLPLEEKKLRKRL